MLETLALMGHGFVNAMSLSNLLFMAGGTAIGIIIGCLPGLSAAMGVALLLPMTFTMAPETGLIVLGAIYCGAIFGGSISAILIHTPGTPASAATAIEGYQLTLQGKAGKALAVACFSSFCGGLLSCISLYFFAPLLAQLAMKFGSPEYFWLSIFGLTIIAGVASKSLLKGLISGALGLLLSTIGMDPIEGAQRFMFGQASLYEGINTTCALIGLFSMSQVLILAEKKIKQRAKAAKFSDKITLSGKEIKRITPTILRSWVIGNLIGILPGAGASIACFLGYNTSRQFSHHKEEFGKGSIEGVAGSEAANNAVTGGSLIPMLTLGIPGESVTAIEGYQLTLQGKAGKALAVACFSSFCGGLLSCVSLYFFAPLLAQLAMKFGSPEYFWLSIFGLTIIAGVASKSLLKGLISGALGLLLSTIGMDPMEGAQRFMFGQASLYEGINTTCALIGLFSMSQVLILAEKKIKQRAKAAKFSDKITLSGKEIKRITPTILRSWIIGNLIGILPGAGASIACFLGYNTSRQFSHHKEEFGKGSIEGVAGSEAANNAVTGGSLIPMLTLGIPGESVTAVLMGGLIIQGLQPGPELFTRYAPMTYTFFAGFVLVQFFMLGIGLLGCRGFAQISRLSDAILIPSVAVLCVVGSFAIHKNFFDVVIMMIFGVLGYLVRKFDLNPAAIVLALILGPIGENGLRRSLRLSGGSPAILFSTPLCWVLIALCVFGVCSPIFMNRMEKKAVEDAGGDIPNEIGDDPVRTSD